MLMVVRGCEAVEEGGVLKKGTGEGEGEGEGEREGVEDGGGGSEEGGGGSDSREYPWALSISANM